MRHIAIQRTSTVNWVTSCPWCNDRKLTHPHLMLALQYLMEHIEAAHPRVLHTLHATQNAEHQLKLAFNIPEVPT